jgi:hypothetical protein
MQTMCRLRVNLDETRLALEDRNNSLEQLQESIHEKERVCKCNELMIHALFFCWMVTKGRVPWSIICRKKDKTVTGHIVKIIKNVLWL